MIAIANLTRTRVPKRLLYQIARRILKKEQTAKGELSVALVGEKRMQELNRVYRGKDEITNVLSFPMKEFGLGELVLCPAKIRKDAKKYGIMFKAELRRMFIHGLLHLLGYSHKQMQKFA